ncbi:MAG: YitT family protein [Anaerorhabdus sp.]
MKNTIKDLIYLIFGNFLLAFAVGFFLIPYDILSGGVVGVAVVLKSLINLPTEVIANSLVIGLFFVGWLLLGKKFAVQTVISSFLYPIFLTLTMQFTTAPDISSVLASFYGGLVAGIGIGFVLKTGASTGGMDIPPLVINKYTKIPIAYLILVVDACTVMLGLWAYDLGTVLVGFISVFATTFAIDKIMTTGTSCKSIQIISDEYQEISNTIHQRLDRGTTIIDAKGGYTNEIKKVVLVVVEKKEYTKIIDIVNEIDKKAFLIVSDATDVHGEGFSFAYRV